MRDYHPTELEAATQAQWEVAHAFHSIDTNKQNNFYCLSMMPYPSGELHMGHVRNYVIGDVIARYETMRGKNVMQPWAWDAFGLPAENAAIANQLAPSAWTQKNIATMRAELKRLGLAVDWHREISTCEPSYYRWEQWLFIQLFKKGLAYKKKSLVNWDPIDHTVLANEQVIDGKGWRSGAPVERREISQWFLKITDYAEELLKDLDTLAHWPAQVIQMQRNWIGKSEGVDIIFKVDDITLSVFTTRPDTLMGVTYVGIAVEHPLAQQAAQKNAALKNFLQQCKQSSVAEADIETQEKVGMNTGLFAIHPVTQEKIPVWVTNFVLMEYGSGAVMAVPAHDERDHAFAEKYHLPIKHIDALSNEDIQRLIIDKKLGKKCVHYRLRDWGISRQRYWGTPIPMVHCEHCGDVPVNEKDLPVLLPTELIPTGKASVLTTTPSFYETTCPTCHQKAHRETDTMDTFMESSWYHARIASFDCTTAILDDRANHWLPVNQYIGGIEHAILHLLYARFIHKVLRDFEFLKSDEPFEKLLTQGMVLKDGAKMSKSKGNVVPPEPMIKKYGADTVRLFMMFASPPEQSLEWSDAGVEGAFRFLKKVWRFSQTIQPLLSQSYSANLQTEKTYVELQQIVQQANQDMERQQFNTVVSASMKLLNAIQALDAEKNAALIVAGYDLLLRLLAPITPHLCDYLWRQWHQQSILKAAWPSVDARALQHAQCDMVIQINGKLRAKITLDATLDEAAIKHAALTHDVIQPLLKDKNVSRVIVIPKRLINIVVS